MAGHRRPIAWAVAETVHLWLDSRYPALYSPFYSNALIGGHGDPFVFAAVLIQSVQDLRAATEEDPDSLPLSFGALAHVILAGPDAQPDDLDEAVGAMVRRHTTPAATATG